MALAARLLALALLPPLLLAPAVASEEKGDRRAAVRTGIRDLARCMRCVRMGSSIPRDLPGLTAQVNALLDAPREDLAAALGELLLAEEKASEGRWSDGSVKRIAAFLTGVPQTAERKFEELHFVELHGFALLHYEGSGTHFSKGPQPPPEPEVSVGPGTRFRRRLAPRPFDLLKDLLSGSGEAVEAGGGMMGDSFRSSAGLELGEAARKDPEFAKFLLAVAAEEHAGEVVPEVLTAALGRWAGPGAVEELRARLKRALALEDESEWYGAVSAAAAALNEAGADAALAALATGEDGALSPERRARISQIAGGEAVTVALLEKAEAAPTAENLRALAFALNEPMNPRESVATRLRSFRLGARVHGESKDAAAGGWSLGVMQTSLWAGLWWRLGHMQGKNFPEDFDREAPLPWGAKCGTERDYFLGAWPDPAGQGRALEEDFAAKRFRVDERWKGLSGDIGEAESLELRMDRAREKDPGVDVKGRREGEAVVLTVSNRRKTAVAVNTLAPKYAVAVMVPLTGEPKGRVELDLQAGRVLQGYPMFANPGCYHRIEPGASFDMTFATGKLPEGSRVLFTLRDEMEPDGDLGVPVLRQIWDLTIR